MKKIIYVLSLILMIFLVSCDADMDGGYYYNYSPIYSDNTEEYNTIVENKFEDVLTTPQSTFSIDVDTASYSNVRRFLNDGELPTKDAVRIEELINYFDYDYPEADNGDPINIITEVAPCPWNNEHQLAMIALKGTEIEAENFPPSNLVFLIDVSGSMAGTNKLSLVKSSLILLANNLRANDRISIVTYAGRAGVLLQPTSGDEKNTIIDAIDSLGAGGSTAGAEGIRTAYNLAEDNFIEDGNNRIILATDGDFNVGISSQSALEDLITEKRETGIYLSVLGFGSGNIKDNKMETLADKGNGNYAYIDSLLEAKKVLIEQMGGTLLTIAKDVKIQVDFNPANTKAYRLIGYENRVLNNEEFEDDTVDAGEIGAGFVVTAFYEIVPTDSDEEIPGVNDEDYQNGEFTNLERLMKISLRYKEPEDTQSQLREKVINVEDITSTPSENFYFASAVAEYGLLLFDSDYKGNASFNQLITRATNNKGEDEKGYRSEFIRLAELAKDLWNQQQ